MSERKVFLLIWRLPFALTCEMHALIQDVFTLRAMSGILTLNL